MLYASPHPFFLDSKSLAKDSKGPSSCDDTCSTNLSETTLLPQASTIINNQSNHHISYAKSTAKCTKGSSSISGKKNQVSGLESFRESPIDLQILESATSQILESATSLISSARRPSSNSNYDSSWGKWVSWCSRKEIDPAQCSVHFILDFLAELFDLGYKYSSINSYRSAISTYHCYVEGKPVGQHKQLIHSQTDFSFK